MNLFSKASNDTGAQVLWCLGNEVTVIAAVVR